MNYKRFSDLESVSNIDNKDLFAISKAKQGTNEFESNKVTFEQFKEQLEYDLKVVEVAEMTPPPESDDTVYISINGYRVPATRPKEQLGAIAYPTSIPRIIPVTNGFRTTKGRLYTVPFTSMNLELSSLSIKSDTNHFSTLEVVKLDNKSGYINLVSNYDKDNSPVSIVTVTDEASQCSLSLSVLHSSAVQSTAINRITIENNIITTYWARSDISSNSYQYFGVIEPKFTLSEDIKHKIIYESDYFNQSNIHTLFGRHVFFVANIILLEPFTGQLAIKFEDLLQGAGCSAIATVDYKG